MHAFILHEIVFCLRDYNEVSDTSWTSWKLSSTFGSSPFPVEKLYPGVETIRLSPTRSVRFCLESILVGLGSGSLSWALLLIFGCYGWVSTMMARSPDAIYQIDWPLAEHRPSESANDKLCSPAGVVYFSTSLMLDNCLPKLSLLSPQSLVCF